MTCRKRLSPQDDSVSESSGLHLSTKNNLKFNGQNVVLKTECKELINIHYSKTSHTTFLLICSSLVQNSCMGYHGNAAPHPCVWLKQHLTSFDPESLMNLSEFGCSLRRTSALFRQLLHDFFILVIYSFLLVLRLFKIRLKNDR